METTGEMANASLAYGHRVRWYVVYIPKPSMSRHAVGTFRKVNEGSSIREKLHNDKTFIFGRSNVAQRTVLLESNGYPWLLVLHILWEVTSCARLILLGKDIWDHPRH